MKKQYVISMVCALLLTIGMVQSISASDLGSVDSTDSIGPSTASASNGSEKYPFKKIKSRVAKYKEVNKDVIGWLTVPGTNINEPITFSAKDNNYYVQRDWRGTYYPTLNYTNWNQLPVTAAYLDYRASLGESWKKGTSRNLVIYGHNWNNLRDPLVIGNKEGYTMFAQLKSYTNKDFAAQNPYVYYSTGSYEGIWKVFSVAYCELKPNFPYNSPNPSKDEFNTLIKEWKSRSMLDFNTDVNDSDRLLTLSTCTRQYNMGDNQRFVVIARLLRSDETENDKVKVTANANMKKPQF